MSNFIFTFITLLIFGLVLYGLWRKDKTHTKYANFKVPVPEADKDVLLAKIDTPLDIAVNEVYPQFDGMAHHFERLSEDSFRSYCHSGGIGMKIRNHFHFWEMHNKQREKSTLYEYLENYCHAVHPDGMSDMIIKGVYRKYYKEHPEAYKELERFTRYKNSSEYHPNLPFDIRYPDEK